ncbi:unnamed protein product [Brassica rapa]|uniref:Defensin-like domain-containing protein n=1 Tax=Brassica campestris TaxID=3711 RepID=A0A3P6BP95_BRACM|nr:unnamed protein product [Brassica rapa]VDD07967.1 unnamed protein product [Brassica rapa]
MGTTKTLMTCLLAVILAASLSNQNVLVSGRSTIANYVEIATALTDTYAWYECQHDCSIFGYKGLGECASPSPKEPKRCCCQP